MVVILNDKYFDEYISEKELKVAVNRISSEIINDYSDYSNLVIIGVLNGAIPFMNDIVFKLPENITIDYVKVTSYGDSLKSTGEVKLTLDTGINIEDKDVILIDDILDTGLTLSFLKDHFTKKNPRSIRSCFLFYKEDSSLERPDYSGIKIGNDFIIGYGLDYAQKGRNINRILKLAK
ncbi:MAG: hypoxanthine phosphoribosyltransferase [Candidatus Delongbacteria bacterium]|nr:hypoxanthine phosphoribosyltransferase [Candidatus Delongbacteria bacterium]